MASCARRRGLRRSGTPVGADSRGRRGGIVVEMLDARHRACGSRSTTRSRSRRRQVHQRPATSGTRRQVDRPGDRPVVRRLPMSLVEGAVVESSGRNCRCPAQAVASMPCVGSVVASEERRGAKVGACSVGPCRPEHRRTVPFAGDWRAPGQAARRRSLSFDAGRGHSSGRASRCLGPHVDARITPSAGASLTPLMHRIPLRPSSVVPCDAWQLPAARSSRPGAARLSSSLLRRWHIGPSSPEPVSHPAA